MAASTAIVVRRQHHHATRETPRITATTTTKRRARRANAVNLKQIGYGVAGAAASAAVTAGLVSWLDMRPWVAGLATGGIGAVSAVALGGPIVRPFAAGAALAGGAVAMTSALLPIRKASPTTDQKQDTKQLASGPATSGPASSGTAAAPRQAGTVSDAMRMQIRQAMRQTQG